MAWTINNYNIKVDKTKTIPYLGKNGILYEYIFLYGNRYTDIAHADDVKSRKKINTEYDNGKRPGQYQPVGDKRYFNFYQLKKMTDQQKYEWALEAYKEIYEAIIKDIFGG